MIRHIPDIIAGLVLILLAVSFWRLHQNPANEFNVFDLVMEGGRLSRIACVFLAVFLVASWIMVRLTLDGKMTDAYLLWYGGTFVAPVVAKLFGQPKQESNGVKPNGT